MGVILGYMVTSLMTEIDIDEIEVKVIAHNLNHYIPSKESATHPHPCLSGRGIGSQ